MVTNKECKRGKKGSRIFRCLRLYKVQELALALIHLGLWLPLDFIVLNNYVKVQCLCLYHHSIYFFSQLSSIFYVNKIESLLITSIIDVKEIILFIHHLVLPCITLCMIHVYLNLILRYLPFFRWSKCNFLNVTWLFHKLGFHSGDWWHMLNFKPLSTNAS